MKELRESCWWLTHLLIGWGALGLLRRFVKRDKSLIAVVGGFGGNYADNAKYFYCYSKMRPETKTYFITTKQDVSRRLRVAGEKVLLYPGLKCVWILLRAKFVVLDNQHQRGFFAHLTRGAIRIQLWHGVGFKQLCKPEASSLVVRLSLAVTASAGWYATCTDWFVSTSQFYIDNVFRPAYRAKRFVSYGYPRTDVLLRPVRSAELIGCDQASLAEIRRLKTLGMKIVAYTPTYRPWKAEIFNVGGFDIVAADEFARERELIFIIKAHPFLKPPPQTKLQNIIFYASDADLYPCFQDIDCMITDYSSIYSDYLLLDRPIIFYAFDQQRYLESNSLQFDFSEVTPGAIVTTMSELLKEIEKLLISNLDDFVDKRARLRQRTFDYLDGRAAHRIYEKIVLSV